MAARVLVEDTFKLLGNVLNVLLPLRLKELEALAGDHLGVLLLQMLNSRYAFVEGWVGYLSSNRDLHGGLTCSACHF